MKNEKKSLAVISKLKILKPLNVRLKFSQNQYEEVGVRDPMIINHEQIGRIAIINQLKIEQETESINEEEDSGDNQHDTKVPDLFSCTYSSISN